MNTLAEEIIKDLKLRDEYGPQISANPYKSAYYIVLEAAISLKMAIIESNLKEEDNK